MYKVGMAISNNVLSTDHFYSCDIRRDLRCDVATIDEAYLKGAIKRLDVEDKRTLVHRMRLNRMTQSPGTGIRSFLASLQGQAAFCQCRAKCKEPLCTHKVDYNDKIIEDNLIRGSVYPEIMSDLLGDPETDKSVEVTVSSIAQKEQGKVTKGAVGDSVGAICATRTTPKTPTTPGKSAGYVSIRHTGIEMTTKPDIKTARPGHSHVLNVHLKDTILLNAAGALLVVPRATAMLHLKPAHRQQVAITHLKTIPYEVAPRTLTTIMLVMSMTYDQLCTT